MRTILRDSICLNYYDFLKEHLAHTRYFPKLFCGNPDSRASCFEVEILNAERKEIKEISSSVYTVCNIALLNILNKMEEKYEQENRSSIESTNSNMPMGGGSFPL